MKGLLTINESQVVKLVKVRHSIKLVKEAYVHLAKGEALNPERAWLSVPDGVSLFSMPAYAFGLRTVSVKIARLNPQNPGKLLPTVLATVYVYDSSSGVELARIEAEALTALRTAASSAVATDYLARQDCGTLGIIGTGTQAKAHVPALLEVRKFSRVLAYSRDKARREAFAANTAHTHHVSAEAASSPEEVVESSDVLVLATNSRVPLFNGNIVRRGTHVNAVGAALPDAREVDSFLVKHSRLVVDSIAHATSSYGDILIPLREGTIVEAELSELGELLLHPVDPNRERDQITLFKSGGLAVLDAILADHLVSRALQTVA